MEFLLLGPFEAHDGGCPVAIGNRRQERCLLAILLLHADRLVTTERLMDLVWDGEPPATARGTIQTYVGRIRRALAPHGVEIIGYRDGYRLDLDGHTADTETFARLLDEAANVSEPADRVALFDDALGLWRGPLLADIAGDPLRERLGADIADARLTAEQRRAEALLEIGDNDRVITALTPLAALHPTRERLVAGLMTALYRGSRQSDALAVYRLTRRALVAELGIEPGPELQALHEQILRNDPRLERAATPIYQVRVRDQWLPWQTSGHPALEFCNTYAGWGGPRQPGSEWLRSYATLAVWAEHLDLADAWTVDGLLKQAQRHPRQAAEALEEARGLRTDLYACMTDPDDMGAFRAVARLAEEATRMSSLVREDDGLARWKLSPAAGLRLPMLAAAKAAADLLGDPRRHTIRVCPSTECGWLFLDHTGQRRWCSMATCGAATPCGVGQVSSAV
jgi:DNA-binding SARP family transcriptional activator/predicted RNA-binding Zn ribbon-like protein